MLDALKFVQGAVSKKDYVPILTHFQINAGRVTGFDGKMCLSAPIALDIDCCPHALTFVKAIEACSETVQLNMTSSGRLSVRSGKFRAHIMCGDATAYPESLPEGERVNIDDIDLLGTLKTLYQFTAEDASRPWAAGILLDGPYACATNNVIAAQVWLKAYFPYRVCVPRFAIAELLRIGEEPVSVQLTGNSITFHYSDARWLRTQLNAHEWPDIGKMLDDLHDPRASMYELGSEFFEALESLRPFLGPYNQIFITDEGVSTAQEEGASVDLKNYPRCSFNARMLALLEGTVDKVNLDAFAAGRPCAFFADAKNLRGAIAGMRIT